MVQAEIVSSGVHVADRVYGENKVLLYQINGIESFYVEVAALCIW